MPVFGASSLRGSGLAAISATLLVACGPREAPPPAEAEASIVVVDATGAEWSLPGPAARIVSLVPSATQTIRALGVGEALVGRTDFDTGEWLADVPSVGGGLEPNLEEIVALQPDLVIRFAGEQDARTPARLDDFEIPHVAVRPDGIEDVYAAIELIGRVTGSDEAAFELVESLRGELSALEARVANLPRLSTLYVLGGTPPWVAGPGTYVDQVVSIAGGDNVFADLGALYSSVSPEEIRARAIDVVLVSAEGDFDASLAPAARIVTVGSELELPGPGVADAAWALAERLHGTTLR